MAGEKPVMLVAIDETNESLYGLEWTLDRFYTTDHHPFKIILLHVYPPPSSIGNIGPGFANVLPNVDEDLKKTASRVTQTALNLCNSKSVKDVSVEVMEGDAQSLLCESVEKHKASMLVLGSHGYGALKRALLGSLSDYCVHNACCTVMLVKKPENYR